MIFDKMLGKVMSRVECPTNETLIFTEENTGVRHLFYHEQDCCENVYIEDVCGNLSDLEGVPILMAEMVSNSLQTSESYGDTEEWTFYKFATVKGFVTVRWYGTSNGYYSTSVDYRCEE